MGKFLIRPAMIVLPLAIGLFFPGAGQLATAPYHVIRITLFFMIFLAATGIEFRDLKPQQDHIKLLAVNILLGVIPFMVCKYLLHTSLETALTVFFIGITPSAAASSVIISLLNGKVGFGLTGFIFTNAGISLALLGLLPYTTGNFTANFCVDAALTIILLIVLPMSAAQLVRKLYPEIVRWVPRMKMISLSLWSLSLFILAARARQSFNDNPGGSGMQIIFCGLISLLFCAVNFYLGGKIASGNFKSECSQLLGQKNTVFSICLALAYVDNPITPLALTFYIVWHNIYNAGQLWIFDRKRRLPPPPGN